jgi:SNF2 family DNA or RNA helicase
MKYQTRDWDCHSFSTQANRRRYRIIIDEAQCIKNRNSLSSKAAHELMATHRLVMTGTPMMNSIDELFPLLRFLKIKPYNDWHRFNQEIGKVRP